MAVAPALAAGNAVVLKRPDLADIELSCIRPADVIHLRGWVIFVAPGSSSSSQVGEVAPRDSGECHLMGRLSAPPRVKVLLASCLDNLSGHS